MHRSGNGFSYITEVPKGKHLYRFFVDDNWTLADDQTPATNVEDGELYNLVDLTNFKSLEEEYQESVGKEKDDDLYSAVIPSFDDDFIYR